MPIRRIAQVVYVFIRALLADLRLAPAAVSRAYLEPRMRLIEQSFSDTGVPCSIVEVLDDGWMRAYMNGKDVLISVTFSLSPNDLLSTRRIIKAVKRFGMAEGVISLLIVPPAKVVMSKKAYVPRIEKR